MIKYALPLMLCLLAAATADADGDAVPVVRGDLTVAIHVTGTIEPGPGRSVLLSPAAYRGRYVVTLAVEPGTRVKTGDVVLRFDDRALGDSLESARFELDGAQRAAEIAAAKRTLAEEATKESLERLEYDLAMARMRLDGYRNQQLVFSWRQFELDLGQVQFGLENAREELRQLERMYSEDELVDETEEIVLARARHDVKNREGRLALRLARREYSEKFDEAPALESLERDVARRSRALRRAEVEADLAARSRSMEVERSNRDLELKQRKLRRLAADLEGMIVRAPADGILLHGGSEGSLGRRFGIGQLVNASEPVVTVAADDRLVVVFKVPLKERLRIRPGQEVTVAPKTTGAAEMAGRLASIRALPGSDGHRVTVKLEAAPEPALLGAKCEGAVVLERLEGVLLVPADRIRKEGERAFCRIGDASSPREVEVKLGPSDGDRVVVTHGLSERDSVLPPGPKK